MFFGFIFVFVQQGAGPLYILYFLDHLGFGLWTLSALQKARKQRNPGSHPVARVLSMIGQFPGLLFGLAILCEPQEIAKVFVDWNDTLPAGYHIYGMVYFVLAIYEMGIGALNCGPLMYLSGVINHTLVLVLTSFAPIVSDQTPRHCWGIICAIHGFGMIFALAALVVNEFTGYHLKNKKKMQ